MINKIERGLSSWRRRPGVGPLAYEGVVGWNLAMGLSGETNTNRDIPHDETVVSQQGVAGIASQVLEQWTWISATRYAYDTAQ